MSHIGTVDQLVEYLNTNRNIFEREKSNKEYMERIMSMLSQQNMEILEREFELYPKGLELPTFIYLMKKLYNPENQIAKYYFVSDLLKFFQAIDVNGDGHLEWSQFTEYIIENIRRVERPNYKNKVFQENEIISSAYSKISNQYKITKVIDPATTNCIKKIIYTDTQKKYFILEANSRIVSIYDFKFLILDRMELPFQSDRTSITDFALNKGDLVFCALIEGTAKFCNLKMQATFKQFNNCDTNKLKQFHKIEHLPNHNYWAFLSKCGQMKLCSAEYRSRTAIEYSVLFVVKQHESIIMDICEIEDPFYIVTSSMDGNIRYFSTVLKKSFNMDHTADQTNSAINSKYKKGLLGLDYTREFGNYLLSYGFNSTIHIYNLDISLTKGFTGRYIQHSGNLLTAKFLKSFPYVLSFDDKLSMRIWDFRSFQTVQIINCQKNFINPSRLEIIPELSEFLVCEKKITQFRAPSLQRKSKQINEFHSIFDFKICSTTNNIFLFTSNDVRIYNYVTGCLEHIFTKLNENSFETNTTACEFGYKSSKFFLGDAGGFVREYWSDTGELIQQIAPNSEDQFENKAIVSIIFLKEHSLLLVSSQDGRIMIYARQSDGSFQIVRDIRDSHYQLTCAAASARYCMMGTGGEDGSVNLWNIEKLTLEALFVLRNRVIHIAFSPIHPIMLVFQETGEISLFYIKPQINLRNKCFLKLAHITPLGELIKIHSCSCELVINSYLKSNSKLMASLESNHHFLLSLGDSTGNITIVNLNEIIEKYSIPQNHQISTVKSSIKCETHSMKAYVATQRKKLLQLGYSGDGVEVYGLHQLKNSVKIEAHREPVDRFLLVKENGIILSTSSDKKLKLWSFEGQLNGAIDFFTFKKINWRIAEMNFHKKLQAIDMVIYSVKLIENKELKPKQEQFIKINLLIKEYMNQSDRDEYLKWISLLRRGRKQKVLKRAVQEESEMDVRDKILTFKNVNDPSEGKADREDNGIQSKEFNFIYEKLVKRIKNALQRNNLPQIRPQEAQKEQTRKLNCVQEVEFKREIVGLQKPVKRVRKENKKMRNLMFKSLGEVHRDVSAMENYRKVL